MKLLFMRSTRRFVLTAAGLALPASRLAFALPAGAQIPAPGTAEVADWDVPEGHFYTQNVPAGSPKDSGYLVSNMDGVSFWRDYRALGGPAQLGYPVSGRFQSDGQMYQATEVALLHWNWATRETEVFPIFKALSEWEMDGWLEGIGIPPVAPELIEGEEPSAEERLGWLTNDFLRQAYTSAMDAAGPRRLGLPMGEPQRFGPYLAQRFERAVLQLWLDNVPGQPAAGSVTLVQVSSLLRQLEMIPEEALTPQVAPAPRPSPTSIVPALAGPAPASSVSGKHIVVSLSRQWWFAYEGGRLEYNGPVTTGRPELYTPAGSYTIMRKHSPYTFVSPWAPGSPFWYETATSSYALQITSNGIYLHDAPWRPYNGPGTNVPHVDPDGVWRTGSHGCINMRLADAAFAYRWAPVGTPVDVIV
jgi:lipoprotein-anchoring transpeptidase ErfK/SrfK